MRIHIFIVSTKGGNFTRIQLVCLQGHLELAALHNIGSVSVISRISRTALLASDADARICAQKY